MLAQRTSDLGALSLVPRVVTLRAPDAEASRGAPEAHWPTDVVAAMTELCSLFPSLRKSPGTAPFNAYDFLRHAATCATSEAEIMAANFVLSVWNPYADWSSLAKRLYGTAGGVGPFQIMEARTVWDEAHIAAFSRWLREPFWP